MKQLDEQLTQKREATEMILKTKETCAEFEEKLIQDTKARINSIEIDVRSWTLGSPGMCMYYDNKCSFNQY